jgi:hypothetical protein
MDDELRKLLDFDIEIKAEGHKSSEGDGRTAADIEREIAEKAEEEAGS